MAAILRRTLRKLAGWLVILCLLVAAYGAWMHYRLGRTLDAAGVGERSIRYQVARSGESAVKTSLPFVIRASVKRRDAQNFLPDGDRGLIDRRLAFAPGGFSWQDDPPSALPTLELLQLKGIAQLPVPMLIDQLDAAGVHQREVAAQELRLRTGQDLGYRPDLPPDRRAKAIAAWRKWWEENQVKYGTEKVQKKLEEIFQK